MNFKQKIKKVLSAIGVVIIILVIIYEFVALATSSTARQPKIGITFSKQYSTYLGLDWKTTFQALEDLNIKYWRIPTLWEEVESKKGVYDFTDVDWQLEQIANHDGKVILVVGWRQPRWPECHHPDWVKTLSETDRKKEILDLIATTVNHFKNNKAIEAWQVENEPLLNLFGECAKGDPKFLKEEVALVKQLDNRQVVITGSGELAPWYYEAKFGDILASTMYRSTWNKFYGYASYWFIPASSYRVKAWLFGHQDIDTFWISELQAEPWIPGGDLTKVDLAEQYKTMSPDKLQMNIDYAVSANTGRIYFWGAEWWYYTKAILKTNDIWDVVKKLPWQTANNQSPVNK